MDRREPTRRKGGSRLRVKVSTPARTTPSRHHPGSSKPAANTAGSPQVATSKRGTRPPTRLPNTGSTSSRPPGTTRRRSIRRDTRSRVNTAARPPLTASRVSTANQVSLRSTRSSQVSRVSTVSRASTRSSPGSTASTPGPYGQPPAGPQRSKKTIGTIIGVLAAVLVAAILVLGFWAPGFFVTTKLDVGKAEAGVQQILTDGTNGYGAKNVKDVKCNGGQNPTVKKGASFDCDVSIDGTKRSVTVTFQDNKGTYEVGRPK